MTKELTPEELSELRKIILTSRPYAKPNIKGMQYEQILALINQLEATQEKLAKYEAVVEAAKDWANKPIRPEIDVALLETLENLDD